MKEMRVIIVTGRSGSGKSITLHLLEDLGYYCIDNLPASLLQSLTAHIKNEVTVYRDAKFKAKRLYQ